LLSMMHPQLMVPGHPKELLELRLQDVEDAAQLFLRFANVPGEHEPVLGARLNFVQRPEIFGAAGVYIADGEEPHCSPYLASRTVAVERIRSSSAYQCSCTSKGPSVGRRNSDGRAVPSG